MSDFSLENLEKQVQQAAIDSNTSESEQLSTDGEELNHDDIVNEQEPIEEVTHSEKVLAGKYKAEMPKTQAELKRLREELTALKNNSNLVQERLIATELARKDAELAELRKQLTLSAPVVEDEILRDEDIEILGDAATPLKTAITKLMSETKQTKDELAQIKAQHEAELKNLQLRGQTNEQQSFHSALRTRIPNVDEICDSPEWAEFVNEDVPFTDMTINQALIDADSKRNISRAETIFKSFAEKYPNFKQTGSSPTTQKKFADIAVPGRVSASASQSGEIFPRNFMATVMKNFTDGRIDFNQVSKEKARFDAALSDGRVK
jgi:TolA-binding protein